MDELIEYEKELISIIEELKTNLKKVPGLGSNC
jgi:hypothetical protein